MLNILQTITLNHNNNRHLRSLKPTRTPRIIRFILRTHITPKHSSHHKLLNEKTPTQRHNHQQNEIHNCTGIQQYQRTQSPSIYISTTQSKPFQTNTKHSAHAVHTTEASYHDAHTSSAQSGTAQPSATYQPEQQYNTNTQEHRTTSTSHSDSHTT